MDAMSAEVREEFDNVTGDVKAVGDYTFADVPPLGKGSFACVRLAYRPSKIEAPVRYSLITRKFLDAFAANTSNSMPCDDKDVLATINRKSNSGRKILVTKLFKNIKFRSSKHSKPKHNEQKLSEMSHDSESSEETFLIDASKKMEFWIMKLSRTTTTTSELNDTEKSQREGSTNTTINDFDKEDFVAIKIIKKSLLNNMKSFTRDSKTKRMTKQTALDLVYYEIALMKKIRHPNLLRLHEVLDSQANDHLYIVLEYCPLGEIMSFNEETQTYSKSPLCKIATYCHVCGVKHGKRTRLCVTENGCFDEKHSAGYIVDVLCGLAYLHRHNVCHRDLKPENILLDASGHCKIADFGMSQFFENEEKDIDNDSHDEEAARAVDIDGSEREKFFESDLAVAKNMHKKASRGLMTKTSGTWCFYAPEMCGASQPYSAYQADIWAAGVCLYAFLTGKLPFYSKNPSELFDKILIDEVNYPECLSPDCRNMLESMLNKDFEKRAGVGECLSHAFCAEMKILRHSSMKYFMDSIVPSLQVFEEDLENAITTISVGTAAFVMTAAAKFKFKTKNSIDRRKRNEMTKQ